MNIDILHLKLKIMLLLQCFQKEEDMRFVGQISAEKETIVLFNISGSILSFAN